LIRAMRLALFQPDIAQNVGTILRMGACLGIGVDIVEPCGFPFGDASLKRAALDYLDHADFARHESWDAFLAAKPARIVLMTTKATVPYTDFAFRADDTVLLGRESAGVPTEVARRADARVLVPLKPGMRSLNVAVAAAMVAGEALRQTHGFPRQGVCA
jgi:tRNA (cytidine/uridine-2'-O-)-methyltransferase